MDDLTDNITQEIDEMFAEFSGYRYLGVSSSLFEDMQIFGGPRNTDYHPINIFNENLADVFINWYDVWAAQHGNNGDINAFLRAENLHELLNKEQFVDLVGGRAFVPAKFLEVMKHKLPFSVYISSLCKMNNQAKQEGAYCIDMPKKPLEDLLISIKQQIIKRKREYYLQHKQEFYDRCVLWRAKNKEHLKEVLKQYRHTHAKEIAEIKRRYYNCHKETLLAKTQQWREENPEKVKENSHKNYVKNREKRRLQNKEWVKNNPEARRAQKQRYYEAHAEEVKARMVRNRNKKRFRTKTGVKILALLQGIVNSR